MSIKPIDMNDTIVDNRLRGLWRMMRGYQGIYLLAIVAIGIAAIARSAVYFLLAFFVDDVLTDETMWGWLPALALGFIGLALVQGGFTFLGGRWAAYTSEGVVRRLRDYLYDHLQRLTFTYHDTHQTGELLQRATSDVDTLRKFYAEQTIGFGRIVLMFTVNFAALLLLNVELALLSVIIIPVVLIISLVFFNKMFTVFESFQEQEAVLSNKLQENLTGVRVVKAFARQQYESDKFEVENHERYRRGLKVIYLHAAYWPITDIMCGAQMLFGFFTGAVMTINGTITLGMYVAYMGLVIQIIWPIRNLGRLIAEMSTGFVAYQRITTIMREVREPLDDGNVTGADAADVAVTGVSVTGVSVTGVSVTGADVSRGAIVFDKVTFAYEGEQPVLHDISFSAEPGQTIALMGATGAGKTSLVSLLPRFYDYQEGAITLDGVDLRQYTRGYLRHTIGIVQQEPFLFSRSIRDNITYGVGRAVSDEEVYAAARAAAVHDVIESFPNGYDTMVGERGVTLSGGQKQRVTVARMLLKQPRILIFDDATSSVDTETEAKMRQAMLNANEPRTTFLIAHRIQSVMHADQILVLDNGRIVQRGTHRDLVAQPGIYRDIFEVQARVEDELERDLALVTPHDGGTSSANGRPAGLAVT